MLTPIPLDSDGTGGIETWKLDNPGEGYMNVTFWFRTVCFGCFLAYAFATLGSLGYCFKAGKKCSNLEVYARYVILLAFIACHVLRFSHAGKVCSGSYIDTTTYD